MSDRMTLTAPAATRKAAAMRPAALPSKTVVELPREQWDRRGRLRLSAKALKATIVVDPALLAGLAVPNGQPRVAFTIDVSGRAITGEFNAKSLRRVITAIAEHGAENVVVVAQGRLAGDVLEEAGIVAQPKAAKVSEGQPADRSAV